MQVHQSPASSVVVGVDGSRCALDAALWAVDEAISRDIPLRLVYAIDPHTAGTDPQAAARELATAEVAVRHAFTAIEATDRPVKIEVEILQARPMQALQDASRWAAMLCVGSAGLKHSAQGKVGSTAAALAASAHCPVAIVQGHDPRRARQGWVVAEVNESASSECVLERALEEALLRGAPLRILTTWRSRFTDMHDSRAAADRHQLVTAQLDRRLAQWKKRHPDLDMQAVAVHGSILTYLAEHAASIQLLVVGHERTHGITELVRPPGYATLHNAGCSVLICQPRNVL